MTAAHLPRLRVESLAMLEGGSVSLVGQLVWTDSRGRTESEPAHFIVERRDWEQIVRNADWFRTGDERMGLP